MTQYFIDIMLIIRIDHQLKTPYYMQIVTSIKAAIDSGELRDGMILPSNIVLATYFGISDIVARKAYYELEKLNLIRRVKGKGTFVQCRPRIHFPVKNCHRALGYICLDKDNSRHITYSGCLSDKMVIKLLATQRSYPVFHQVITMQDRYYKLFLENIETKIGIFDLIKKINPLEKLSICTTFHAKSASAVEALVLQIRNDEPIINVVSTIVDSKQEVLATIQTDLPAQFTTMELTS